MGTVISQHRTVIIQPEVIWLSEQQVGAQVQAGGLSDSDYRVILGTYKTRKRAIEVIEEIFKSEYYEMPIE